MINRIYSVQGYTGYIVLNRIYKVYVCFVDYEKAFDRVNWVKLLEVLKSIGVDWRDRRLIERLYIGQSARIKLKDGLSEPAVIGCGTRQGCSLSPTLFNIYYYSFKIFP